MTAVQRGESEVLAPRNRTIHAAHAGRSTIAASHGRDRLSNKPKAPPHSGSWDAWPDGYGTTHTDTLSQPVRLPPVIDDTTVTAS